MKVKTLGRVLPLIMLLLLVLPLTAGATNKTFSAGSVIIPMDPCWQPNNDPDVDLAYLHAACDYQTASLRNDQGCLRLMGWSILTAGGAK